MNNPAVHEALEAETVFSNNPNLVTAHDQLEKARMDRIAELDYWIVKFEQVEQKIEDDRLCIAKNSLLINIPADKIARATGLPLETVESLL